ncbi:hypothetical protein GCM10007891_19540 [Methylophaga thalassica]|uniref:DUF3147 family protein n=1 Tax=Methylophaga thalassica TaxID=40223 RepID=A0ABQ5TZY4_9GAMM|nr:DUF3147 family protein [Methylophaga thalassica]GLQ00101.1 hypothetical protein GCM10007891_19540 [Methylophaga thalassica]
MWYYITKFAISATLIVAISELAKRSSMLGAVLASLPIVSIIAMIWLYHESGDTAKVIALASDIVWLVLPSLVLFIALPILLKHEFSFYLSLSISIALTVIAYLLMLGTIHLIRG